MTYSHFGVESGAVAVLHTWGQNLSLHPHIHCIVPAAGYTLDGKWRNIGHSGNYLYPVHQLEKTEALTTLSRNMASNVRQNTKVFSWSNRIG
jgi:hypothetical protein